MIEILPSWHTIRIRFFRVSLLSALLLAVGSMTAVITGSAMSAEKPEASIADSSHTASKVAEDLNQAIRSGDVERLRSLLAEDVLIFESGNVESSLAEYESHHMQSEIAFMSGMNIVLISRQVIDSGDMATVVSQSRIQGTYKENEIDLTNTETLVLKKLAGQWKIMHIHWSSR